jgi:hypothetical protein
LSRTTSPGYPAHYECTCYHPSFIFNQFGDLERGALRPGNVHGADGWQRVLKPVVNRYLGEVSRIYFRADAGFAMPGVYEYLEAERIKHAIRLPAKTRHFGADNARSGSDCKRPATSTNGPSGKPGKSLRCASNSVFIWGIPDETR